MIYDDKPRDESPLETEKPYPDATNSDRVVISPFKDSLYDKLERFKTWHPTAFFRSSMTILILLIFGMGFSSYQFFISQDIIRLSPEPKIQTPTVAYTPLVPLNTPPSKTSVIPPVTTPGTSTSTPSPKKSSPPPSKPGTGQGGSTPSCNSSDPGVSVPNAPHGIFILGSDNGTLGVAVNQYLLNSPDICGISLIVPWSEVDQGPGTNPQYDWSKIDGPNGVINPWIKAGKIVNIIITGASEKSPNTDTPQYVLQNPQQRIITCSTKYPVPVFWDSTYTAPYEAFMANVVAHFNSNPHIGYIRFGLGNAGEGLVEVVRYDPTCMSQWSSVGYPSEWDTYYDNMLYYEKSLNSAHQLDVGLNTFDNEPSISSTAALAASLGIGIGQEGLRAIDATDILASQPCDKTFFDWCQVEDSVAGKIPLHVQTQGPTTPAGGTPDVGPLPPLLQAAIASHIQIFELQTQDALLAFDPSYPGYSQYSSSYVQAILGADDVLGFSK